MLSGLPLPIGLPEELPEVKVAVGGEGAHAKFAGQDQGLAGVTFRLLDIRRISPGGDFTDQAKTPRLVTTFLVALRQRHGLLRTLQSIVEVPFEQVCLTEPRELHRPSHAHRTHRCCVSYHLFEETPTLIYSCGEGACVSKPGKNRPRLETPLTDEDARAVQRIDGLVEITPSEGHATDARQGLGKSKWVVSAFRNPECLLCMQARLNELPQIREGQRQPTV